MSSGRLRVLCTYLQLKSQHALHKNLRFAPLSSFSITNSPHPKGEHYGTPTLQKSLEKYLQYVKPLIADEFIRSPEGSELQNLLVERAKMEENWLFDWWLASYLNFREPVVVHSSPGVRMQTMNFRSDQEWLTQAAAVIQGVLNFKAKLESGALETEFTSNGSAMCMSQYYAALGNCRISGIPNDRILSRQGGPKSTVEVCNISVLYRNRLFNLVFSDNVSRNPLPLGTIYRQLENIVQTVQHLPPTPPIGLLTSLPRDDWAKAHAELRQSFRNADNFSSLERSLFVLCLDDTANLPPAEKSTNNMWDLPARDTVSALHMLHGNLISSGNRWFDKTVEFIVSRDGAVGLNFEHTPADAGVHMALIEEVYAAMEQILVPESRMPTFANPQECEWELSSSIQDEIERAGHLLKDTPRQRAQLLHEAVRKHQDYTRELTDGKAFDRHLLGLRLLANSLRSSRPELYERAQILFTDFTYLTANHYRLSTSQTRSKADLAAVFGPVVPNGYGVCYNIHPDFIQLTATAFRTSSETREPRELLEHLFTALNDMMTLVTQNA
ncbi:unnamed protein product [Echinostoma caproni]|uniref:Carn_acyltransf domain-containing protein n=1 Tax=Echinostoma caproni TaxID=27848 RepID=A0A183ADG1_9TREM|nr:unnamed protein product [Echinostoma caproni]